jgi:pimeloyl-ACP methyl ester carboxylesterase
MDAAVFREPRRRLIAIDSPAGPGEMAALEFGPQDRAIDVIFVHANGFNAQTYNALLAPLAAGLRILAIDQRGHGASLLAAKAEGRRSWLDLRDDLIALLEALDGPPVVLAGHSMGGTVSLLTTAAVPGKVRGLVLLDPVIMPRLAVLYAQRALDLGRAVEEDADGAGRLAPPGGVRRPRGRDRRLYRPRSLQDLARGDAGRLCRRRLHRSRRRQDRAGLRAGLGSLELFSPRSRPLARGPPRDLSGANPEGRARLDLPRRRRRSRLRAAGQDVTVETVPLTSHFLPMERPDLAREAIFEMAAKR